MSEYIVNTFGIVQDLADLHGEMNTPLYRAIMDVMVSRQREEIVRCRDCKHLNIVGKCPCGFLALENLNGFCAWGEMREREPTEVWNQWSADDVTCSEES